MATTIHLGCRLPDTSARPTRGLSEQHPRSLAAAVAPSYSVLLRLELARFTPACAGIVTVALVLASRRTGVTREPALWSSDFPRTPPFDDRVRGRPAASRDGDCTRRRYPRRGAAAG